MAPEPGITSSMVAIGLGAHLAVLCAVVVTAEKVAVCRRVARAGARCHGVNQGEGPDIPTSGGYYHGNTHE